MRGYVLCAAAAALWGTWPLALHAARLPTLAAITIVFLVVGVGGLPIAWADPRGRAPRAGRAVGLILLLGVLDVANNALYFGALAQGAVAMAVLSHYLAPVLVAAGAPLLLGERLGRRTPVAVLCALSGLALLVAPWREGARPLAAWLGAASAVFYAGNVIASKRLLHVFTPVEVQVYHALVGAALLLPLAARQLLHAPVLGIAIMSGSGLVLGVGAGIAFYAGLSRVPAQHAGVLTYLEPLVAVTVGAVFFHETPPAGAGLGGALIVAAGLAVVTERGATG